MAPTEGAKRAAGLDGLRGIAATCVFLVHIWIYTHPSRPPRETFWDFLLWELRLSVVFFFVLSGFLLFRDFARAVVRDGRAADVRGYAKRRAARIMPAYYVALAGGVLLLWGGSIEGFRPISEGELLIFAVFGQDYSLDTLLRFNPVLWTLGLEVAFYISLPFIGAAAYRLGGARRTAWLLVAIAALGLGWNAAVHFGDWGRVASYALPSYLPYFAFGMAMSLWLEWSVERRGRRPSIGPALSVLTMAGGFALVVADGTWHALTAAPGDDTLIGVFADLPSALGFALVIGTAAFGSGAAVTWTRFRPFVYAGVVSYGFYLWHVPVILFVKRLGLLPESFGLAVLATLPFALAVAAASWHFMEQPVLKRAARRTASRERAQRTARLAARTAP